MKSFMHFINENTKNKGTYAGVRFSENTKNLISDYIKKNNIPNPLDINSLHSTLLFSRKYLPKFIAKGKLENPIIGIPQNFEVWDTNDNKNALVLKFNSKDLTNRHKALMKEHGAEYDYDEYKTHITFSYDVGDFDISELPKFDKYIEIIEEYQEDLKLNWQNQK